MGTKFPPNFLFWNEVQNQDPFCNSIFSLSVKTSLKYFKLFSLALFLFTARSLVFSNININWTHVGRLTYDFVYRYQIKFFYSCFHITQHLWLYLFLYFVSYHTVYIKTCSIISSEVQVTKTRRNETKANTKLRQVVFIGFYSFLSKEQHLQV